MSKTLKEMESEPCVHPDEERATCTNQAEETTSIVALRCLPYLGRTRR